MLLASFALAMALGTASPASAATPCPNPTVQYCHFAAGYVGSWQYSETEQEGSGTATIKMEGNWTEVWNGSYWQFNAFSGSLSFEDTNPSGPPGCSATFSLNPALAPYYGQIPNGNGGTSGSISQDTPVMVGGVVSSTQIMFDV